MKVTVWFYHDIIAILVLGNISFPALRERLMERLKLNDDIVTQYRDEATNSLVGLENDDNLGELSDFDRYVSCNISHLGLDD